MGRSKPTKPPLEEIKAESFKPPVEKKKDLKSDFETISLEDRDIKQLLSGLFNALYVLYITHPLICIHRSTHAHRHINETFNISISFLF